MHYPDLIQSKLPNVGTTIFTVMSKLAAEHNAINLSQGFPDFHADEEMIGLVNKHMQAGNNQYAPMPGLMSLREVLAQKTEELYGAKYDPETEITITAGATQAIFTAISAIIREEDEVIIFEPAYDCYQPAIELNGGKTIYLQLKAPGYVISWEEVKKVISHRTKMIIINTPHNPTGSIMSAEDMKQLEKLVAGTGIVIISDEVYEHIIFDDLPHLSMLRFPDLFQRSFVCFSFGKVFHCTGWKLGYCIAPAELTKEFRKVHQFNAFSCHTPNQVAMAEFLRNKENYLSLGKFFQEKRDYFIQLMKETRFNLLKSSGSYFIGASFESISTERDFEFAVRLTKEYGIATIPLSSFYVDGKDDKVLRFCFGKKKSTLEAAVEKLRKI